MEALPALEDGDAAVLPLKAPVVGVVGRRLNAGNVAVLPGGGVFPEGQVRKLLSGEAHRDSPVPGLVSKQDLGLAARFRGGLDKVNLLEVARRRRGVLVPVHDIALGRPSI